MGGHRADAIRARMVNRGGLCRRRAASRLSEPFSPHVGAAGGFLEIGDATADARFRSAACVTGAAGIRSLRALPCATPMAPPWARIAVFDTVARRLNAEQLSALRLIAAQCESQIELRARLTERLVVSAGHVPAADTEDQAALARTLLEHAPVAIYHTDGAGHSQYANPAYRRIFGLAPGQGDEDWIKGGASRRSRAAAGGLGRLPRRGRDRCASSTASDPDRTARGSLAEQVVPATAPAASSARSPTSPN